MKVLRKIIKIDESKCNGCGNCVVDCHEAAIKIIDGVAKVIKDSLCDGMGDCMKNCPVDAIIIEERLADQYNENEVERAKLEAGLNTPVQNAAALSGCPGSRAFSIKRKEKSVEHESSGQNVEAPGHWPMKIRLVPANATYLKDRQITVAADCSAFFLTDYHSKYAMGNPVLIGCPKFDNIDLYIEKLTDIILHGGITGIKVTRMEVPCCTGLLTAVKKAVEKSGKNIEITDNVIKIF